MIMQVFYYGRITIPVVLIFSLFASIISCSQKTAVEEKGSEGKGITLTWNAPTTNFDGSKITDLAGYRVYYGASPDKLTRSVNVGCASCACKIEEGIRCSVKLEKLDIAPGKYYLAVTAYDAAGNESGHSAQIEAFVKAPL